RVSQLCVCLLKNLLFKIGGELHQIYFDSYQYLMKIKSKTK
ncbi:hypothetical protein HMPREF1393_00879, partial [Helicobacter pylori GAM103Bi]